VFNVVLVAALVAVSLGPLPGGQQTPTPPTVVITSEPRTGFDEWLEGVRTEARTRGIRDEVIQQALSKLEQQPVVVERDQNQAEFTLSVDEYLKKRLTAGLIANAKELLDKHRAVLRDVSAQYGIPEAVLIAVWGLESNFGRFSGIRPTIPTIATLAYEPRRAAFFRNELFSALDIVNRGDISLAAMQGSWAGAMGQPQFMPSAYLKYAVDFDKDGKKDIWRSLPDVFASTANYLKENGWVKGETWGREVRVPAVTAPLATAASPREAGCLAVKNMSSPQPLGVWQRLGVRLMSGAALPKTDVDASLVQGGERSFLVYRNYEALLAYNCAHAYALSVGLLADRLTSPAAPAKPAPARRRR
jgi:membrane-bound lytic murein transglycosylase B